MDIFKVLEQFKDDDIFSLSNIFSPKPVLFNNMLILAKSLIV